MSFDTSTSSSAIRWMPIAITSRSSARAISSSSTTRPRGSKITSTSTPPPPALNTHAPRARPAFMPPPPRLEQPCLRRSLGLHARVLERLKRALGVLGLHDEVEVVARLGPAARPDREASGEQGRDVRLAERGHGLLQAGLYVVERVLRHAMHLPVRSISIHARWVPCVTMPVEANGRPGPATGGVSIKLAAAADIHCNQDNREQIAAAFAEVDGTVDLILLAGDLTTHGEPEQAQVLADAC